jgi:hypothetical protein
MWELREVDMRDRILFLALLSTVALTLVSCSSSSNPSSAGQNPTVEATTPADGATDVGLVQPVEIQFSEALDPATVDESTLVVSARGLTGYVEYDDSSHTASFTPDTLYAENSSFDVTVSGDIKDLAGNAIGSDVTTSFQTGAFDCAHLEDSMEPNDSIEQAAPVEMGRTYHTLTGCGDDSDFFKFTLASAAEIHCVARYKQSAGQRSYIYFLRHTGEDYDYVGADINDGDLLETYYTFLPGTYYLEIAGDPGYTDWVLYDLSVAETAPCPDDAYEDNDFLDEATPIVPGIYEDLRGCNADRDYYSFHVDSGQTITFSVEVQEETGASQTYYILRPSGEILAQYLGSDDIVNLDAVAVESGTHYVMVRYRDDGSVYNMEVSVVD